MTDISMPSRSDSTPALLHNGSVYSQADPFASAMIVEAGSTNPHARQVVWVGSEQAARAVRDDRMTVTDLDGDLLTPAFVNSSTDVTAASQPLAQVLQTAASQGVAALVHTGTDLGPEALTDSATDRLPTLFHSPTVDSEHPRDAVVDILNVWAASDQKPFTASPLVGLRLQLSERVKHTDLAQFLTLCMEHRLRPTVVLNTERDTVALTSVLHQLAAERGERQLNASGLRLEISSTVGLHQVRHFLDGISGYTTTVCLDPLATQVAAEFYRRGTPVTLGWPDPGMNPWRAMKQLLNLPEADQSISTRAAFTAATRGAWRALGRGGPMSGQLVPGAPASYARWEVQALMVQAPSGTGASWSTDPRARTPLLPALEDEALPVCVATEVNPIVA
ncbi:hypothetical protein [Kocuria sp.]|uniref:hypothetical protein n=1 Tax=Kocuria sp. TaxID=1871328 RepID=UPI0026DFD92B|nr:hypothetical protein [Kocuria sp.]MDO5619663.1 hypothetical protein [Kocuria sp.]